MQYPITRSSRNLNRKSRKPMPETIDHYNYGDTGAQAAVTPMPGGKNGMIYRGGYSHDAGSFNIIHGGN